MFESNYTQLQGTITAFAVQEFPGGGMAPGAPTSIIRTDQPWRVHIEWRTRGLAAEVQAGKFAVTAYLESIGPGPDLKLPLVAVQQDLLAGALAAVPPPEFWQRSYSADVNVPANSVPVAPEPSRPYKLVIAVTYITPGNQPGPMAGFQEGPILQFYVP